ncbi:MAG: hypothetical protein WCD11_05000, partial [Solirubrobacteraceae bacterium]
MTLSTSRAQAGSGASTQRTTVRHAAACAPPAAPRQVPVLTGDSFYCERMPARLHRLALPALA